MSAANESNLGPEQSWQLTSLLRSSHLRTLAAMLVILLTLLDSVALYRAIQGNPYPFWKTNTDFGGYLRASTSFMRRYIRLSTLPVQSAIRHTGDPLASSGAASSQDGRTSLRFRLAPSS